MLAKTVNKTGKYCFTMHLVCTQDKQPGINKELTFYLLYGRDVRLPSGEIIHATVSHRGATNLGDYISEMSECIAAACQRGDQESSTEAEETTSIQKILVSR